VTTKRWPFEVHPQSWTKKSSILGGAFFMSKYSNEFEIKVVNAYLLREGRTEKAEQKDDCGD